MSRAIKIHEYQARELLEQYGITVPRGELTSTPEEASAVTRAWGGNAVIKAQVLTGGRGKAGAIRVVSSQAEAESAAKRKKRPLHLSPGRYVRRLSRSSPDVRPPPGKRMGHAGRLFPGTKVPPRRRLKPFARLALLSWTDRIRSRTYSESRQRAFLD